MLQYRHGWIYFAQLNSPSPALNLVFSGNGPIRSVRQELLLYLYHPFLYLEGNWEIGQLILPLLLLASLLTSFSLLISLLAHFLPRSLPSSPIPSFLPACLPAFLPSRLPAFLPSFDTCMRQEWIIFTSLAHQANQTEVILIGMLCTVPSPHHCATMKI